MAETLECVIIMFGKDDTRARAHADQSQHDLFMISRTVDMDHIETLAFDQRPQLRTRLQPRGRSRRVSHVN